MAYTKSGTRDSRIYVRLRTSETLPLGKTQDLRPLKFEWEPRSETSLFIEDFLAYF